MPWKAIKDPYRIWLSEIILQQTRVEQGTHYYNKFIQHFSDIKQLAKAQETEVFKLWEGLGYYSRCKNLIATARYVADELKGKFPSQYDDILKLKGIGPYTAAAISSFAFNLPHAVVDGNVMRVLARYFGIKTPIDSTEGKKYFNALAQQLLDKKQPALYNQAIMDFGATVCKPQQPLCSECYLNKHCIAFKEEKVNSLPVKENRLIKKHRWLYYVIAEYDDGFMIRKRTGKDIWQNLHEFILLEPGQAIDPGELMQSGEFTSLFGKGFRLVTVSKSYKQQLTHQTIHAVFIHTVFKKKKILEGYKPASRSAIKKLAFPRLISSYFDGEGRSLFTRIL